LHWGDAVPTEVVPERKAPAPFRGAFGNSFVSSMALAPDGSRVATGAVDSTILLWDWGAPASNGPVAPMKADQLVACWDDLAGADSGRAFAAIAHLGDVPEQAMRLLQDRLHPINAPSSEELHRLVAELDNPQFA